MSSYCISHMCGGFMTVESKWERVYGAFISIVGILIYKSVNFAFAGG